MKEQLIAALIDIAAQRKTITYKVISKQIGVNHRNEIGPLLDQVNNWCRANGVPDLPALVVSSGSHLPSKESRFGMWEGVSDLWLELEQHRCWRYDWQSVNTAVRGRPAGSGGAIDTGGGDR